MSERKDWRRKQWSEYYKELYQTTTPAQAGTNVWNLWNSSSNKNKEQLNNKNLFLLSLATYRQPVSIGNIVFNITYSSQPIYSTWANWWDGIYWWELEQWEMWYTALKSHYGSVEAKNRWVNAWSYADNFSWSGYQDAIGVQGGYDCDFINYMRTEGIDTAMFGAENLCTLVNVGTDLIDATENVSSGVQDFTGSVGTIAKILPWVIVIGGSLTIYNQVKNMNK